MRFKKILFTLPAIIVAIAIFILSHQPQFLQIEPPFALFDKVLHFIAYFIFGLTISLAIAGNYSDLQSKRLILIILLIGFIFGFSDEIHQYFIPGRDCSIFDWFADCVGIMVSLLLLNNIRKYVKKSYY